MRKLSVLFSMLLFVIGSTGMLFASMVDNCTEYSAEWVRTQARVGSCDTLDSVAYNPAGTVKIANGLYTAVNNQFSMKDYSHEAGGKKYTADNPGYFTPSIFFLYRQDDWSAFASLTIPAGGGSLEFEDGILAPGGFLDGQKILMTSADIAGTIGGAYAINDIFSLSLGVRTIYAYTTVEIEDGDNFDYKDSSTGVGGIIGLNISPVKNLNIGMRYETKTKLKQEVDTNKGAFSSVLIGSGMFKAKGQKFDHDLPALASIGVSYMLFPVLKVSSDLNYCFIKNADWEKAEKKYDNGWEVSLGLEYTVSEMIKASMGYQYADQGEDKDNYSSFSAKLVYHQLGGGFQIEPVKDLKIDIGVYRTFFVEDTSSSGIKSTKEYWNIAAGASYKFF